MATPQVDAAQVEEFIKPAEETTVGSPTIEGSTKSPALENIKSPYDDDDDDDDDDDNEEVILPDELAKEKDLDDENHHNALSPQIIEDKYDEDDDDDAQDQEPAALKSTGRGSDYSEEEGEDDDI
ncbi:hypothetical protein R6Q57_009694 [Mikania cordata]